MVLLKLIGMLSDDCPRLTFVFMDLIFVLAQCSVLKSLDII
jgi:hypothetical protein